MVANMSSLTRQLEPAVAPLGRREERRAIQAAVASLTAELADQREARFRVLGAEVRIEKPARRGAVPGRLVAVLVVDYAGGRNLAILVDGDGRVVRREELGTVQPALHPDEIREAREIAGRDERVAALAGTRGLFAAAFAPEREEGNAHRLVGLHYLARSRGDGAQPLVTVVVDLSDGALIAFRDDRTGAAASGS